MSLSENKALIRRYFDEFWNQGNLAATRDLIAEDAIVHYSPHDEPLRIGDIAEERVARERRAFPDLHFTIEDLVAEGDKVVARWTMQGTHQGEYVGIAPTGKRVTVGGINIYRVADGKIAEIWVTSDDLDMLQQLNAALEAGGPESGGPDPGQAEF
jgi:steroid delta-isomerase-like uncharacterized protein